MVMEVRQTHESTGVRPDYELTAQVLQEPEVGMGNQKASWRRKSSSSALRGSRWVKKRG